MRERFLSCFGLDRVKYGDIITIVLATLIGVGIIVGVSISSVFTLAFAIGVITIFEANKFLGEGGDRERILITKVMGAWISLTAITFGAIKHDFSNPLFISGVVSFGSFLLFSLWRPSTISWLDKNLQGGLGVVLSEALAGFAGGIFGLFLLSMLSFDDSLLWRALG